LVSINMRKNIIIKVGLANWEMRNAKM
jgi:hypothetical protein